MNKLNEEAKMKIHNNINKEGKTPNDSPLKGNNQLNISASIFSQEEIMLKKRLNKRIPTITKSKDTEFINDKRQFEHNKKDVELKKFQMDKCIKDIEYNVLEKEKRRNALLQNEFEKERNYLIDQQKQIKFQIEDVSKNNMNEKFIKMLKDEINAQQELFNKYFVFNNEIVTQINKLNDYLPETKIKIEEKKNNLKKLHLENINLLERLNQLEKQPENSIKVVNSNSDSFIEEKGKTINLDTFEKKSVKKNNSVLNHSINNRGNNNSRLKYNEYGSDNSINISVILNENYAIKEQYERKNLLKQRLKVLKDELNRIMVKCGNINTENINLSKLYSQGTHEISLELLNVHESQLERINELGSKALYHQLLKQRANYSNSLSLNYHKNDIKLPLINHNIMQKYRFPVVERENTHSLIYNVIKNLLTEHNNLNKNTMMKRKKFDWEEFSTFSGYQIFTLMSLNPEVFQTLERKLFPKSFREHKSGNTLFLTENTII